MYFRLLYGDIRKVDVALYSLLIPAKHRVDSRSELGIITLIDASSTYTCDNIDFVQPLTLLINNEDTILI
jgi:hypothetical protein